MQIVSDYNFSNDKPFKIKSFFGFCPSIEKSKKFLFWKFNQKPHQGRDKLSDNFLEKCVFNNIPERLPALHLSKMKDNTIFYKMIIKLIATIFS